jgi:CRP/FNR family cyclic AMP-dependent transcriptional regulator
MKLELAEGSAEMLREVLIHSLSELRMEMAYATRKELREFLKKRGELLEGLIRQIEVELAREGREWISIDRLRHVGILRGLTDWELNIAAQYFQHETLASHTALFEEGGKADRLYILEEGAVSLQLGEGEVFPIQTPGELIGWSFLVPPYRYTASAMTAAPSKFLVLRSPDFHYLIHREPRMGVKIMANVAEVVARRLTHFRLRL